MGRKQEVYGYHPPMKREKAGRETANVTVALTYTEFVCGAQAIPQRADLLLSQSVMRWYQPAHFFMCMLPSTLG